MEQDDRVNFSEKKFINARKPFLVLGCLLVIACIALPIYCFYDIFRQRNETDKNKLFKEYVSSKEETGFEVLNGYSTEQWDGPLCVFLQFRASKDNALGLAGKYKLTEIKNVSNVSWFPLENIPKSWIPDWWDVEKTRIKTIYENVDIVAKEDDIYCYLILYKDVWYFYFMRH